jgi:acetyl esterase/lipase
MSKSLSYHLVLLVLKLKGIKRKFQGDPVDVIALRGEDVHVPKGPFYRGAEVRTFMVSGSRITERKGTGEELILYIHGGAFVCGPAQHHWDTLAYLAERTGRTVWLVDYPKAPEHQIDEISQNIDAVWELACQQFHSKSITLIGDSVGGTLAVACTQRSISTAQRVAGKLILVSPVVDASFENPLIDSVEPNDPMLARQGVLSSKRLCAGSRDLRDPMLSPLFGNLSDFPDTYLFIAEHDITYPDQLRFVDKLTASAVRHLVFVGRKMPHIWPLLPIMKEARSALNEMVDVINGDTSRRR